MSRQTVTLHTSKTKKKRPGVHSKTRTSISKNAKHYKKKYRGQGK